MDKKPQFDTLLGGTVDLPSSVQLIQMTAARFQEIEALEKARGVQSKGSKLVFQTLPKHMRRRVMSHTVKRLPSKLQDIHENQLKKSGLPAKQKRPSRKYRRRPRNLLMEYNRRQRRIKWLETHIWHAKRFHMIERWGYKIAHSPCDKAFRACYRASAKHCLLQDISYFGCIEITGEEKFIIENFRRISDSNVLGVGAKAYLRGNREGETVVYKIGEAKPIGRINFNWMPQIETETEKNRVLWIWAHPAYFEDVLHTLILLFDLKQSDNECYASNKLILRDCRYELNRFRLTGPLSQSVLYNSLKCINLNTSRDSWIDDYLKKNNEYLIKSQFEYWESIKNVQLPSELSPHIVISLIAEDPRFNMPKVRTKAKSANLNIDVSCLHDLPVGAGTGPIWDRGIRKLIKEKQISTSKLLELRSNVLVDGIEGVECLPVPYLLIQRPGNKTDKLGYSSGWDIIVPNQWALPTWLTLVMWGGRAGGLRESDSLQFELGRPNYLEPDTRAGQSEEDRLYDLHKTRYFKLPSNRRCNFIKLSIASPFKCNWKLLLNDWNSGGDDDVKVLRNAKTLKGLKEALTRKCPCDVDLNGVDSFLVPIKVTMKGKGCPKEFAIICLPEDEDDDGKLIVESSKNDVNQGKRERLRDAHRMNLKKMKRSRIKARLKGKIAKPDTETILKFKRQMEKLWLPSTTSIRNSCSREVIGFVVKGGFSFTAGTSMGVGYTTLRGLYALLKTKNKNTVLVRNTTSKVYKAAFIDVVI